MQTRVVLIKRRTRYLLMALVCLIGGASLAVMLKLRESPALGDLDWPTIVTTTGGELTVAQPERGIDLDVDLADDSRQEEPVTSALQAAAEHEQALLSARIEYDYGSSGIASARLSRDYTRSRELELLRETLDRLGGEGRGTEAERKLLELVAAMEMESSAEELIRAGGFKDALVIVGEQTVEAIVASDGLDKDDAAVIGGILSRVTGRKLHEIRIKEYQGGL
ncbi:MAG: SpoIIIAH-like family protein [Bacillota bacterium]